MSERFDNTPGAETPADAGSTAGTGLPRIALLYADEALLSHVEQTLAALRVPVVYRAAIEQVDHAVLKGARPEIALINLDDRCDDKLDVVTAALDAAGVPIVFNDADISNGLEGWARARWARHLCAKLCGKDDVDPPRPAQVAATPFMPAMPAAAAVEVPPARTAVAEPPAMAAEIAEPEPPAGEPASASRPLSQGEIDALVADFPSEAAASGVDTEAWSAQIDALLASAPDSASQEPAPWDVIGFAEEESAQPAAPAAAIKVQASAASAPTPAKVQAPAAVSAPAKPAAPPSADQWQLVEDFTPVTTAPREKPAPAPAPSFGSGLALELEPMDSREDGQ